MKKSPKQQPPQSEPAPAKQPPVTIKRPLTPEALRKWREFMKDSREIERQWWRINY